MIVVMRPGATEAEVEAVCERVRSLGFGAHVSKGAERTIVGAIGEMADKTVLVASIEAMPGVEKLVPILKPFKLVSREFKKEPTVVRVGDVAIGGDAVVVIGGPCAVESREQLLEAAREVKAAGGHVLRGGAYKPRTSPYSFQGLEEEGLRILAEARERFGIPFVTEVMSPETVPLVAEYADMLQVGARNMQNFALLRAVGRSGKPVLLKRGLAATIQEWLMAAEYILAEGNYHVVLCERGIRTFETETRNTLDLNAVPVVKELSHLPVVVDPSHGTGKARLVPAMARAAVAAGADGIIVEVHPNPALALSDGPQSLDPPGFAALVRSLRAVAAAVGRSLSA
ncbi:MAG: 3-deoxy-7-phosphoheptulonate synthase [Clostridia bacterium]|nr:3-deoxy-7-phosphoheptulonate synthase [Clostridia bacterium]